MQRGLRTPDDDESFDVELILKKKGALARVYKGRLFSKSTRPVDGDIKLTPREMEIVQLLADGKSNKEISLLLAITVNTAETHRSNIMRKLEYRSMSQLVRYAIRNGLIHP